MEARWVFAPSGGGETVGFNDAGINTFKAAKIKSVAREVTQNSLDASSKNPVGIIVDRFKLTSQQAPEFFSILENIKACSSIAPSGEPARFFAHATNLLESGEVSGLLFHDKNTTGLVGELDGPGPWRALTRSAGVTQKASGNLGSFGHGARAPFALSGMRTVLYLTQILTEGRIQRRAVGRSILMSHKLGGSITQGVGFFGKGAEATPLIDEEIPSWLNNLRPAELGEGTTLAVFDVRGSLFTEKFQYELIRSYALAIEAGNLEVEILGTKIDKAGLEERWAHILDALRDAEGSEFEVDQLDLENLETIFNPHQKIKLETPLGTCELRLRSGDATRSRSVAIARGGGMLITSKPERLKLFSGLKNFSCVVWVSDPSGSSELAKLENPAHDEFSKDWLASSDDQEDSNSPWAKYMSFTATIREKLKELYSLSTSDTFQVKLLDNLLDGVGNEKREGFGTSRTVRLIDRDLRLTKRADDGTKIVGPGVMTKGTSQRKAKGPRVIPTADGGNVATGGWKPREGFATCRVRTVEDNQLFLRVDLPQDSLEEVGIVFVGTSSSGEVVALHDEVGVIESGGSSYTKTVPAPLLEYSIDVFLFERHVANEVTTRV